MHLVGGAGDPQKLQGAGNRFGCLRAQWVGQQYRPVRALGNANHKCVAGGLFQVLGDDSQDDVSSLDHEDVSSLLSALHGRAACLAACPGTRPTSSSNGGLGLQVQRRKGRRPVLIVVSWTLRTAINESCGTSGAGMPVGRAALYGLIESRSQAVVPGGLVSPGSWRLVGQDLPNFVIAKGTRRV